MRFCVLREAKRRARAEGGTEERKTAKKAPGLEGRKLHRSATGVSDSFVRNTRYQDPDQWRARKDDDTDEQYRAYKYQKSRNRGAEVEEDLSMVKANLLGKEEQVSGRKLRLYAQYRKEAKSHGSWAGKVHPAAKVSQSRRRTMERQDEG